MLPFYAAAALIVVVAGSIIAWNAHRVRTDIRIRPVAAPGNPTRFTPQPQAAAATGAVTARGAWVLSALPDCVLQRWERRGPERSPLAATPPSARPYAQGARVRAGACVIDVLGRRLMITRGGDRFEVPAVARLYAYGGGILVRHDGGGRAELRAYRFAPR